MAQRHLTGRGPSSSTDSATPPATTGSATIAWTSWRRTAVTRSASRYDPAFTISNTPLISHDRVCHTRICYQSQKLLIYSYLNFRPSFDHNWQRTEIVCKETRAGSMAAAPSLVRDKIKLHSILTTTDWSVSFPASDRTFMTRRCKLCIAKLYERQILLRRVQPVHSRRRIDVLQRNVRQLQRQCWGRYRRRQFSESGKQHQQLAVHNDGQR